MNKQHNELEQFSGLAREIKRIARLAGDIELTAINGMIMANKSGGTCSGFGVAAHEIQALSLFFLTVTQELTRLIYQMAYLVGKGVNQARRLRILNQAALCNERSRGFISAACENGAKDLAAEAAEIRQAAREVMRWLQRADAQCIIGIALGFVGKLESVYDTKMAVSLRQVSAEVQDAIVELFEILKNLNAELQEWL